MGKFTKPLFACLLLAFIENNFAWDCSNDGYAEMASKGLGGYYPPQYECPDHLPVCPALCGECMTEKDWDEMAENFGKTLWHSTKCNVVNHGNIVGSIIAWFGRKKRSTGPDCLEQINNSKKPADLDSECMKLFLTAEKKMEDVLDNTAKRIDLLKQLEELD